eukprot:COSAG06_NODE_6980_length_2689_cov_1.555598_5_plen_106_part_00
MRWLLFVGSLACFIGLYDAEVMQGERTMMFFCESTLGESEAVSAPFFSVVLRATIICQDRFGTSTTKPHASNRFVSHRRKAALGSVGRSAQNPAASRAQLALRRR